MISREDRETLAAAAKIKAARAKALKAARRAVKVIEKGDRGRIRDTAYLQFLRRQACVIGAQAAAITGCTGPVQAAHLRYGDASAGRLNPGMGVKPSDRWATPLCAGHHAEQHAAGNERRWWQSHGLDGSATAKQCYADFLATGAEHD